jgi:hypothetical protein
MWVDQLLHLGVLEQLLCTCLPYGFVGLRPVAVLTALVAAGVLFYGVRPSRSFLYVTSYFPNLALYIHSIYSDVK